MPRLHRNIIPGLPYHVVQRGNNRQPIFRSDMDYRYFRKKLCELCVTHRCFVHAYVFMTNHVHLLMTPTGSDAIPTLMQGLGRCYVRYFNTRYERTGTLWEGRYRAAAISSDKWLFRCYRYIEMNPVRAAISSTPCRYRWSSYHANATGSVDALVTPHALYLALDRDSGKRLSAYRALFDGYLTDGMLGAIRRATSKGLPLA